MWKKVLYLSVAFIFGIIVALLAYNSNQYNNIYEMIETAIAEENYDEIPMIFGGCHDKKEIVLENNEKVDAVIYNGTALTDLVYGTDGSSSFTKYENSYYIYLFNSTFSSVTYNETENHTALVFTADNGNKYPYYYVVNSNINSDQYSKDQATLKDVLLKASRDLTIAESNWGLMSINLTSTMADFIEEEIGGAITGLEIVDNEGNVVADIDVDLDFSQQFFTDVNPLISYYNQYLEVVNDSSKKEEANLLSYYVFGWQEGFTNVSAEASEIVKNLNKMKNEDATKYESYKKNYDEGYSKGYAVKAEDTGYSFRHNDDFLSPSGIIWQTVGMMCIYALVIVAFYILLFHFDFIKGLFSKDTYKEYGKKGTAKKPIYVPADKNKTNSIENKEETPVVEAILEPKEDTPQE